MAFPNFRLDGRVALVTGSGQGIGRSLALGLANAGATVALVDVAADTLREVEKELISLGKPGIALPADVADPSEIQRVVDEVARKHGRLDILVNNAGIRVHKRVLEHTLEDWEMVFKVNCSAVFLFSQAAARLMRDHGGGSIINISSQLAVVTHPQRVAYCASKAAVVQMTRVMAVDWGQYKIRVNCIAPGPVKTPFTLSALAAGDMPIVTDQVPLGRMADADEMIGAAIYLASDASTYVTGSVLVVDAGQSVHWR